VNRGMYVEMVEAARELAAPFLWAAGRAVRQSPAKR
jgi:hypothetical protein